MFFYAGFDFYRNRHIVLEAVKNEPEKFSSPLALLLIPFLLLLNNRVVIHAP
jgi:hypothetical protein